MAEINVTGDMIQIKTSLTEKEFDLVQYYKPEVLKLVDEQGNELFGITKGNAHASKYGISFCNTDSEGKLFMTTENPVHDHSDPVEERKLISREFAQTINNLQMIETQVANEKPNIRALEQNANRVIHMNGTEVTNETE